MATTRKLQNTVSWALPLVKNQPLDLGTMEPALTFANLALQTIFSPPLKWRFNRGVSSFPLIPPTAASGTVAAIVAQSDYVQVLPDFGYLEDQYVIAPGNNTMYPITANLSLPRPVGTKPQRPTSMAAQFDDDEGNITFRTKELPDQAYTLEFTYQRKVPTLRSLGDYLPFPDDFAFVFDWGFLTVASLLIDDPRFQTYEKYFIGKLLGLQEGLDEVARSLFLGNWEALARTQARGLAATNLGAQGRTQ